jgi:hypothetical protein
VPRPRTNNPKGVSDNPVVSTDPVRIDAIVAEFQNRLKYIHHSFIAARKLFGTNVQFNEAIKQVRRSVRSKNPESLNRNALQGEVAMVLSHFANEEAATRAGPDAKPIEADYHAAALRLSKTLQLRRGRPRAGGLLRHHVEGLMALLQETSGKPAVSQRDDKSVYNPQFLGASSIIPNFFRNVDPSITDAQLATIVTDARREYAGKPMRFSYFFPGYGMSIIPTETENTCEPKAYNDVI